MPKRRKPADVEDAEQSTPRKTRRTGKQDDNIESPSLAVETPSGRKSILRGTPSKANGVKDVDATPRSLRKVLFSTPAHKDNEGQQQGEGTPTAVRNDRSARRKSARTLQKQTVDEEGSVEEDVQEAELAKEILDEEGEAASEADDGEDIVVPEPSSTTNTPTKRRGRPPKQRDRTPSPPPDLPPHELYFFQNRTGGNKTSSNTLPSHLLLNHEDYFAHINDYKDPHEMDVKRLAELHKRAFDQWSFELEEGFNICLYGYGSKRELVMEFAEHMYYQQAYIHAKSKPKIVIVNGYTPGLTIRDILITLAGAVLPKASEAKLPAQPTAVLDLVLTHLTANPSSSAILLIIHSLDHSNLRKAPIPSLLARIASHSHINLLATVDTPNFGLLWDTTLLRQYQWLYHDATTFQPYRAELDVVEEVNALLGRSRRRLGGKDGVAFVLKSLPENARNLFRILVAEQLALADAEPGLHGASLEDDDDDSILGDSDEEAAAQHTPSRVRRGRPAKKAKPSAKKATKPSATAVPEGVEYRTLYHKAVAEFVCSSELNFRTLLKEFHDHQMIESRKDALGTERLVVPFGRVELEGMLEELA
ncbi:Origin recognition complex subunit 2 [Vermiconidia calcicola]|uniref:Origin recognition complex subunit 2 n=1 Tax=Vermiconidia calcicola TaxID=1690605 RepID=A0ACC3NJ87_9PEZI|nr:Origin recognition complex subunit 2 [Vermiconidia calcicola]